MVGATAAQRGQLHPHRRREFLDLAGTVPIRTMVTDYPLDGANDALADLAAGRVDGAAVLVN